MYFTERFVTYTALGLSVVALGTVLVSRTPISGVFGSVAIAAPMATPAPSLLASCDVYQLVERMIESPEYLPARSSEQERIRALLLPLETELAGLERELQTANPQDPAAQEKYKAYQTKREEYGAKRQSAEQGYSELVSSQFVKAFVAVTNETKRMSKELGYTHVIAQKTGDIAAKEPRQLVEEFLSRPLVAGPEGIDITEAVRSALKLPVASSPATPATPAVPTPEAPASTPAPKP